MKDNSPLLLLLTLLFNFYAIGVSFAAAVQPLDGSGQERSGVEPIFKETKSQVQPISIQEPNVKKVSTEGRSKIYNGKVEQARLTALRIAYAEAIQQVAGLEIRNLSITKNVKQVSDIVLARSKGFIRSFIIIKEGVSEKDSSLYEVLIDAEVVAEGSAKGSEKEGLLLYLKLIGEPKILILLPEENNEKQVENIHLDESHMRSAEAAMAQAFNSYGYQVMTSDDISRRGTVNSGALTSAKEGATARAIEIAKSIGADIIMTGVIRVSQTKVKTYGMSVFMTTTEVSAKAIIVSSGRVVHAFHQAERTSSFEPLQGYTEALDRIADAAVDVLAWKIPQVLTEENHEILLKIHNVGSLNNVKIIRDILSRTPEIDGVRYLTLPTTHNNILEIYLLISFVQPEREDIIEKCEKILLRKLSIVTSNKYQIELQ
jgi:hypothetical protein